jgi:cytochrome c oxidase subunit III
MYHGMPVAPSKSSRPPGPPASLGQLGMVILMVSISVLFFAACVAVIITRHQVQLWRLPGQRGLPWGTGASSLVLVVVSGLLQRALRAIRANRFTSCLQSWRWAGAAALAFLFLQALNARQLLQAEGSFATRSLFVFSYDLLVGLHAVHVLGGFVPLMLVHTKIARGEYSSSRHSGLLFCVQYWHYLTVIWLILLVTLACIG